MEFLIGSGARTQPAIGTPARSVAALDCRPAVYILAATARLSACDRLDGAADGVIDNLAELHFRSGYFMSFLNESIFEVY